jgi:hypothetical protein
VQLSESQLFIFDEEKEEQQIWFMIQLIMKYFMSMIINKPVFIPF